MRKLLALLLLCAMLPVLPATAETLTINVGDTFFFGAYEQDNDTTNGSEMIEWVVLDVDHNREEALVLSKYALDTQIYHNSSSTTKWHNTYIRNWLNSFFVDASFLNIELNEINQHSIDGSLDYVFLLNEYQFNKYVKKVLGETECEATPYALSRGACYGDDNGKSAWWIRKAECKGYGAFVGIHGGFYDKKNNPVSVTDNTIRPAMYVTFDAVFGTFGGDILEIEGVNAITLHEIGTRSGPSTQYDGLGTYFDAGGELVRVLSRQADNNDLIWLQVEFSYGGKKVRVYTGYWRVDIDPMLVPEDPDFIGSGRVTVRDTVYYGPGTEYKKHNYQPAVGSEGQVLKVQNGFVWMETRDANGKNPRRFWIPESNVSWTAYP